ncbi:hypothetical protein U1839_10825 [Sphingomonas sp. RT2P30]|uniref:hypothetical protein n=1 Tax=Parasphingomonas halimpatiens TaxID=3096162 RepID=UPI002FCAE8DB
MIRTKMAAAALVLAVATLAGCDRPTPQPAASDNAVPADEGTPVDANVETNLAEAAPPPPASAAPAEASAAASRAAPPAPDAQTLDDADATGMTARVHRGEETVTNTTP